MAVWEAGLKVEADVKLPLQRRRAAAAKIAVKHVGFAASAGAGDAGDVFGAQTRCAFTAEPGRSSARQGLPPFRRGPGFVLFRRGECKSALLAHIGIN